MILPRLVDVEMQRVGSVRRRRHLLGRIVSRRRLEQLWYPVHDGRACQLHCGWACDLNHRIGFAHYGPIVPVELALCVHLSNALRHNDRPLVRYCCHNRRHACGVTCGDYPSQRLRLDVLIMGCGNEFLAG